MSQPPVTQSSLSYRDAGVEIDAGDAGLMIERRAFLEDGRAVELTRSFYRGDAYDMVAELGV